MRVFLGGTCNKSTWRDSLIPELTIEYFNPVVPTWTAAAREQELLERNTADILLYVLTPEMAGYYSVAEVVEDSIKEPKKTVFCVLPTDNGKFFGDKEARSLEAVKGLVARNGAIVCNTLDEVAQYLNSCKIENTNE